MLIKTLYPNLQHGCDFLFELDELFMSLRRDMKKMPIICLFEFGLLSFILQSSFAILTTISI